MSCCIYLFNPNCPPQDLCEWRFDLVDIKALLCGYKDKKRYLNQLKKFPVRHVSYEDEYIGNVHRELIDGTLELYTQGWFFKKRFLNRKYPIFIAITKKGMVNFLNKNLKFSDPKAVEKFNKFVEYWEDGMIFVCRF